MNSNVKILPVIILVFMCSAFSNSNAELPPASLYKLKTVVIDAGHGGHDGGCSGSFSKEKIVTLSIALKLGKMIEENFPDVKVIYTRKTDVFIELYERASIANRNDADLFISIHCNANQSTSPYGTETYVMGLHKTEANLSVAKRENDVVLMETNYSKHYEGFNPNDPTANIIFSLFQHAFMEQSILFASKVEEQFTTTGQRKSRGVKQAGFLVLWKTSMPAVLIETGFLTNITEEKFLGKEDGQQKIADCIFKAFTSYKTKMENTNGLTENTYADNTNTQSTITKETLSSGEVEYRIQFLTSGNQLTTTDSKLQKLTGEPISFVEESGIYKYRLGPFNSLEEAVKKQTEMRTLGFSDAFVIALKDNIRISVEEAKAIQPK
ncbi:MAG: N-acetylmuramoyl-L-alanine amidase [Bacteroidetes bacterium]|nr:N-acetylmuramoyl-L-alanine amidase [Bacteroidota bacterium]MBK8681571.1 N-acetylmuramoyl-L-alanine amidase [Bacteroidota bacterium]